MKREGAEHTNREKEGRGLRKGRGANRDKEMEKVKTVMGCRTDMEEGKIGMGSRTGE